MSKYNAETSDEPRLGWAWVDSSLLHHDSYLWKGVVRGQSYPIIKTAICAQDSSLLLYIRDVNGIGVWIPQVYFRVEWEEGGKPGLLTDAQLKESPVYWEEMLQNHRYRERQKKHTAIRWAYWLKDQLI